MLATPSLSQALQNFWGYSAFRPGQEDILRNIIARRDTCVVMPTGGGKSLCYQLPAAMDSRCTAVVISPLIALMHDQVAQLQQMGIPAALVNSSQGYAQRQEVIRRAARAEYRLLYLSPESVALDATLTWLKRIPISFFAIDEAHCISEWGHEFRPEYRQLNRLRTHFPGYPVSAFTASATQRVRHDIVEQLNLRDPFRHVASFYRPNLRYSVKQCTPDSQGQFLLRAIQNVGNNSVIVYVPTIARVQETVEFLEQNGIPAIGYHGKMESAERRNCQEKWMQDEVRVIVCTIAFGLGINKPSVRAVIHLALPKGLEQFYQEAGRAGRDGLPADCILLWQKRDAGIQGFFLNQISDGEERERAWQRYHDIRRFADTPACRQLQICRHFGESPAWDRCGNCDVCAGTPEWLESEPSNSRQPAPHVSTSESRALRPVAGGERDTSPLREALRQWRMNIAAEKSLPAFAIMHDSTLDELCWKRPADLQELRKISGFGEKKTEMYGSQIIAVIRNYAALPPADPPPRSILSGAARETMRLLQKGCTLEEIAATRQRSLQAVVEIVSRLVERGDYAFREEWLDPQKYRLIADACSKLGHQFLKPLKEALPEEITYEDIKLVVSEVRSRELQITASI